MIDDMIDEAEGAAGETKIYCHPKVLTYMQKYKGYRMEMVPGDNNINRRFAFWNDIPIITTRNVVKGTEDNVVIV